MEFLKHLGRLFLKLLKSCAVALISVALMILVFSGVILIPQDIKNVLGIILILLIIIRYIFTMWDETR